jgi:hypothetical protein
MMEFYKGLCSDDFGGVEVKGATMGWDPMLGEASAMCRRMVGRPLSFSLPPFPPEESLGSPTYTPDSDLLADLNEEAAALGYNHVVHFDPSVQLT